MQVRQNTSLEHKIKIHRICAHFCSLNQETGMSTIYSITRTCFTIFPVSIPALHINLINFFGFACSLHQLMAKSRIESVEQIFAKNLSEMTSRAWISVLALTLSMPLLETVVPRELSEVLSKSIKFI